MEWEVAKLPPYDAFFDPIGGDITWWHRLIMFITHFNCHTWWCHPYNYIHNPQKTMKYNQQRTTIVIIVGATTSRTTIIVVATTPTTKTLVAIEIIVVEVTTKAPTTIEVAATIEEVVRTTIEATITNYKLNFYSTLQR